MLAACETRHDGNGSAPAMEQPSSAQDAVGCGDKAVERTLLGAVVGTLWGALNGAMTGALAGNSPEGAAIGAAVGLVIGAVAGASARDGDSRVDPCASRANSAS